jgi:serine/threonine protein kinase
LSHEDLLGKTIAGKYRVKRLIGVGGMGSVYEGEHVEIGKRIAIKVIDPAHAGSEEVAVRFKREARAASRVESENIVQVFDVGNDPSCGLYMVMEYLVGEDLAERLIRENLLDVQLAASIGAQAARALAKAHAAGVVHRDLKPANLFLTTREDGSLQVKILDFGISKLTRDETGNSFAPTEGGTRRALTRQGIVIGTPQYMSPEQAQGLPLDHRTDVWSLGAVLYEALAGRTAFAEMPTYEQTIIQIVMQRPKALVDVAPWVPADLAAIIHEALTHDVTQRLPDCRVFARRIVEAAPGAGRGSLVSPDELTPSPRAMIHAPSSGNIAAESVKELPLTVPGRATPPHGANHGLTTQGVALRPDVPMTSRKPLLVAASLMGVVTAIGFFLALHGDGASSASAATNAKPVNVAPSPKAAAIPQAEVPPPANTTILADLPPPTPIVTPPPPATTTATPSKTRSAAPAHAKAPPRPAAAASPPATSKYGAAGVATAF